MVRGMNLQISAEAESQLDYLDQSEPDVFELVTRDLDVLSVLGVAGFDVGSMLGQWASITGPTGRVTYWITPISDDDWLIETIDVY
jgi:hypothetical protein